MLKNSSLGKWNKNHFAPTKIPMRLLGIYLKESICLHKDLHTWMFMVALFITAPSWEQLKFLKKKKEKNELLVYTTTWTNLKCFAKWKKPGSLLLFSCSVVSDSLRPHRLQYDRLLCLPLLPGICSNSCPLSQWCHPTISSSVIPLSSCLQFFPASGSFPMSQLFASGGQSTGASASASVLPKNIQDWFPIGWTGKC